MWSCLYPMDTGFQWTDRPDEILNLFRIPDNEFCQNCDLQNKAYFVLNDCNNSEKCYILCNYRNVVATVEFGCNNKIPIRYEVL